MPPVVRPEPLTISDLLGDAIDLDERDQYGLFSNITDFVSAEFYYMPPPEKRYKIVIMTQYRQYAAYNNDQNTLLMLRDYIEHYDSISVFREGFEEKWQIMDYDTLGLPITKAEVDSQSRMSTDSKGMCISSAMGLGCLSGCLMGAEHEDTGIADWNFEWMEDAVLASIAGMSVGALGAIIMIKTIEDGNRSKALGKIKEMRKPQ